METTTELLTIHDLAERWGVSAAKAKKHVRRNRVPFIQIGSDADMLVNWGTARFRLDDVRRWEAESARVFDDAAADKPAAPTRTGTKYKYARIK